MTAYVDRGTTDRVAGTFAQVLPVVGWHIVTSDVATIDDRGRIVTYDAPATSACGIDITRNADQWTTDQMHRTLVCTDCRQAVQS